MPVIEAVLSPVDRMALDGAFARVEEIHASALQDSQRLKQATDRLNVAADRFELVAAATIEAAAVAKTADARSIKALEALKRVEAESASARAVIIADVAEVRAIASKAEETALANGRRLRGFRLRRALYFTVGFAVGLTLGLAGASALPNRTEISRRP